MAKIKKRGRKAPPPARRKPLAPGKTSAPRNSGDAVLRQELREARAQQTATSEILKVIASSPSDVQPVFDSIVASAMRLLKATTAHMTRLDAGILYLAAFSKTDEEGVAALQRVYPRAVAGTPLEPALESKTAVMVADVEGDERVSDAIRATSRARGVRSFIMMPVVSKGASIGYIVVNRSEAGPFSGHEIELLKTFADQAVIAIENVRLFNETKESLERQTATAEILKVIASSSSDVSPVFETILENAARLCGSATGTIYRFDGELAHLVATKNLLPEALELLSRQYPMAPARSKTSGRTILTKSIVRQSDTVADPEYDQTAAMAGRWRRTLGIPMLREGEPIGAFVMTWPDPGETPEHHVQLLKTFADQAVIAIENVRLFNETKEGLERQTATAEILNVIASSPADVQPVFDAIAKSAYRLIGGFSTAVARVFDDVLQLVAFSSTDEAGNEALKHAFPMPVSRSKAARTGAPVSISDTEALPESASAMRELARTRGFRSILIVPMLREGVAIGTISVTRREPAEFSNHQVDLLKTFADQAVIAIESVRLFNETKEALERQTATAEILKVIASSPSDVQPVFDAIVKSAGRLAAPCTVAISMFEGGQLHLNATFVGQGTASDIFDRVRKIYPLPFDPERSPTARAIAERRTITIHDAAAKDTPEFGRKAGLAGGFRSAVYMPLIRGDQGIGAIILTHPEAGFRLTENQLALLQTFSSQAVIAIENVRLFNETREALERQTATAEVLNVIASSPSDVQPVFDAIAASARRLLDARAALVARRAGDKLELAAFTSTGEEADAALRALFPSPITGKGHIGQAILNAAPVLVSDIENDMSYSEAFRASARVRGVRSVVSVPMLREGEPIGVISVNRSVAGNFSDHQTNLLRTFASQAVIAIENVRLFNETKESLERQTATAEILSSMSGSMTDAQPVFDAIVRNLLRLFGSRFAVVQLLRDGMIEMPAADGAPGIEKMRDSYPRPFDGNTASGLAMTRMETLQYSPMIDNPEVPAGTRQFARDFGFESSVFAPLIREGKVIGAIATAHGEPRTYDDKQIALIESFADQAVIAIENVRLFKELQQRTEALTQSVGQLTALGEVGQAISSTLDLETVLQTIVSRAVQLTGMDAGSIYEYDAQAEVYRLQAAEKMEPELVAAVRKTPIKKGDGATGRTAVTLEPVQVADIEDKSYQGSRKDNLRRTGYRAVLAVPLLREDNLLGALQVFRKKPGPFAPEVVELLKTFATQSAMAIQNARLFREIAEKGKQLEQASQHKSNFLASMSHELRTPLNAILGFNEMIIGQVYGEVPADMQEPLADIQTSGKHLLRLINNVLDLAKIEAGRMELSLQDYSVHDTVGSVHSTLRPLAADKGLEFLATVPEDLPLAYGDGGRITQCLMNLAGNSIKFTKAGKVEISVEEKDGMLTYRVSDTGIGIPPDKIDSLFTEFKQTDATIASEYGGTGLGLSISKKFVEMHGGRIWIESELGKGSTFIIEVPLRVNTP